DRAPGEALVAEDRADLLGKGGDGVVVQDHVGHTARQASRADLCQGASLERYATWRPTPSDLTSASNSGDVPLAVECERAAGQMTVPMRPPSCCPWPCGRARG